MIPNIFCLPQAGADSTCFVAWETMFSGRANVKPVTLPGRGSRLNEFAIADFQALCDQIFARLRPIAGSPIVLLGSSMGGWMAYELAYRFEKAGCPASLTVLLSSPTPGTGRRLPDLSDPATAVADVVRINPAFAEAAEYPELIEMILPTIANDFRMCNAYIPVPGRVITTPMIGVVGDADPLVSHDDMQGWQSFSTGPFSLHSVVGDHSMHENPSSELKDLLLPHILGINEFGGWS